MTVEVSRDSEYWAKKPPEGLIAALIERRKDFEHMLVTSGLYNRIARDLQYYHALYHPEGSSTDMAIQMGDEEGATAVANINHFRSNVDMAVTYIAGDKPAWNARARAEGNKARQQTILTHDLLDAHLEVNRADGSFLRAARHAYVLSMGFLYLYWDWKKGTKLRPDENGEEVYQEGDLGLANPTLLDTFWDYSIREWDRNQWVDVGCPENRWDLLARHGDDERKRDAILAAPQYGKRSETVFEASGLLGEHTDLIEVRHFWHEDTPALPGGRHVTYIAGSVELEDARNDYGCLPVAPLAFGEFLLTSFGYTNAFDMQVPQEWMGAAMSAKLTTLNTLGQPKIWMHSDDEPRLDEFEPGSGIGIIRSRVPPEVKDFYSQGAKGLTEDLGLAIQQQEYMAGNNPVSRGQPEGELKGASGRAFELLDSKTHQANTIPIKLYKLFLARAGTIAVKILKARVTSKRVTALAGEGNLTRLKEWSAEDIADIERVEVEVENPIQRSIWGRVELAKELDDRGYTTTRQEFLTVINTGQVKPLTDAIESQLAAIADENQRLLDNAEVNEDLLQALEDARDLNDVEAVKRLLQQHGLIVLRTDNHILHARRNISVLDTTEMRMNRGIAVPTMAHVWVHLQLLQDPEIQREQLLLGYLTAEQLQAFLASLQIPAGGPLGAPPPRALAGAQEAPPEAQTPMPRPPRRGAAAQIAGPIQP